MKSKRKNTYKTVNGKRVLTNPKARKDEQVPMPSAVYKAVHENAKQIWVLCWKALNAAFESGIAIGRARATKSGKSRKR